MASKAPALSNLPRTEIAVAAGDTFAIETLVAGLNKVAQMQVEGTADGTYNAEECNSNDPFASAVWDIVVAAGNVAGDYQLTFNSEVRPKGTPIGRPALSSRRAVDIAIVVNTNEFTVRSAMACLEQVKRFEDAVASTGTGTTNDGAYTDIVCKGPTPFETYLWDITKADNVYTLEPTASS